jgi:hypothetical protein
MSRAFKVCAMWQANRRRASLVAPASTVTRRVLSSMSASFVGARSPDADASRRALTRIKAHGPRQISGSRLEDPRMRRRLPMVFAAVLSRSGTVGDPRASA